MNSDKYYNYNKTVFHYLVTVRKRQCKDYVSIEDILPAIDYIRKVYPDSYVVADTYELGPKYRQLHWHGWIACFRPIIYKSVCKYGQYRIYWRALSSYKGGVLAYLRKSSQNYYERDMLFVESYAHHFNMFDTC